MPRAKRTRKQPLVSSTAPTLSHRATQATISRFHVLLKRKRALESKIEKGGGGQSLEVLQQELGKVDSEIDELGGLEAYQHASTLGQSSQRGGDSSKILVRWLKELRAAEQSPAVPVK